jgi:hypothetical protein
MWNSCQDHSPLGSTQHIERTRHAKGILTRGCGGRKFSVPRTSTAPAGSAAPDASTVATCAHADTCLDAHANTSLTHAHDGCMRLYKVQALANTRPTVELASRKHEPLSSTNGAKVHKAAFRATAPAPLDTTRRRSPPWHPTLQSCTRTPRPPAGQQEAGPPQQQRWRAAALLASSQGFGMRHSL